MSDCQYVCVKYTIKYDNKSLFFTLKIYLYTAIKLYIITYNMLQLLAWTLSDGWTGILWYLYSIHFRRRHHRSEKSNIKHKKV